MSTSSDWIVNVGTLVLAVAAIGSAVFAALALRASNEVLKTSIKQAAATEKLAEVNSAMFVASSLPLLADVPQHRSAGARDTYELVPAVHVDMEGNVTVFVPTMNVGTGPAIVKHSVLNEIDGKGRGISTGTSMKIVPSGASTIIATGATAEVGEDTPTLATLVAKQFCAIIDYSDYSGQRNRRTILYVIPSGDKRWFIRGVDLLECDNDWNVMETPVIQDRG